MTESSKVQFLQRLKLRHVWILALASLLALLALFFSGKVTGTLPSLWPGAQKVNDITYVSGGIGSTEASFMKAIANDYALEAVFIRKLSDREEYLADVRVIVADGDNNDLLDVQADGPYFLADLPIGKYIMKAEYQGVVKQQSFSVGEGKHQKLVFWWPIVEPFIPDSLQLDSLQPEDYQTDGDGDM